MNLKSIGKGLAKFKAGKFATKKAFAHPFLAIAAGAGYLWFRNNKKKKATLRRDESPLMTSRDTAA